MKPTANTRNQQIPSADTLWTTADLAQFLGCSERQVYVLRKRGLPTLFIGGLIRFDATQVREWLNSCDELPPKEDRECQLAAIAVTGDEDNAECATADRPKEFPSHT
jgi:excisionase family DNA binding protein